MYFSAGKSVTLSGAGAASHQVSAPAGQYVMIENPSGVQQVSVAGADQVLVFDAAAATYRDATTLDVGQGAWALSSAGGTITLTATGPARTIPAGPGTGAVLVRDDLTSDNGVLRPVNTHGSYDAGGFTMSTDSGMLEGFTAVQGTFGDTTVDVDVKVTKASSAGTDFILECRVGAGGHVRLQISRTANGYAYFQVQNGDGIRLVYGPAIVKPDDVNHVQFTCAGTTLSGAINGAPIAAVTAPGLIARGGIAFGVRSYDRTPVSLQLSHLVITEAVPQPGAVSPPAGLRLFGSPSGYQVFVPATWPAGTSAPGVQFDLEARSPDGDQYIFIQALSTGRVGVSSAMDACVAHQQRLQKAYPSGQADGAPQNFSVSGADSTATCTFDYNDGTFPYHDVFLEVIRGQTLYELTLDFTTGFGSANGSLMDQILHSFTLTAMP
jgi:hypothetical protein